MHALVVLDTVRNCVMLQIVDGLGGKGEGRGITVTCPRMIVRILHTGLNLTEGACYISSGKYVRQGGMGLVLK